MGSATDTGELVRQQKDIQAIIRQITASVTFLPLLDEPCSFDLLIYTDKKAEVPEAWDESDPKYIVGGCQEVKVRSFTTKLHKVEGAVAYKYEEDCPNEKGCPLPLCTKGDDDPSQRGGVMKTLSFLAVCNRICHRD